MCSGDVFRLLQREAGRLLPAVESEPGPRQRPIADIARLTEVTDWRPEIPLQQTVADTLAYWRTRKG